MVLHAENALAPVTETFQRLIVQVDMRDFDIVHVQRIRIHRETVIVRGNLHSLGQLIEHRVIRATMPELQFVSFPAEGEPQDLIAQANAKNRRLADQLAHIRDLTVQRFRVARPIRKKHAIRFLQAITSSADVSDGTTVTRHPECTRRRRIFCLMPKS